MPDKTRITGNLVSDNNLYVDPTTDNTGIGTISPVAKLDVVGNVRISSNLNVSGIATVGLGATSLPTSNSTMSFELFNNTTLRVRVRGTDGTIRTGTIALT